jgi:3-carboxy-cis,cis-muconate cycloisomerase
VSDLYRGRFGEAEVAARFSDRARLQAMLDFEAALADAEAEAGVVPHSCVTAVRAAARAEHYDLETVSKEAAVAGNAAIPLVRHLTARVAAADAEAARYVHWGATSQDVLDTALVLQLRAAIPEVLRHLARAAEAAAEHAERHADTPMAGRTWLQQATPVTFGLKAAGWLEALERAHDRIQAALADAVVLQLGGASGTLAALGTQGPAVARALGVRLDLPVPDLPWHAHRDRLAHLAGTLGVAVGTLGKIARDVSLLAQTEVGEAHEAAAEGRGGSSTMPHKRNPVGAAVVLAAAIRAPGLVATFLAAMPQEHERGLGGWPAEWETLPELVLLTAGAARAMADCLQGLVVDTARMRANLDLTHGLVMAEAISMALAVPMGKEPAHRAVEAASQRALASSRPLAEVLAEDPSITRHLSPSDIAARLRPESYLGAAGEFVRQVLARHRGRGSKHA